MSIGARIAVVGAVAAVVVASASGAPSVSMPRCASAGLVVWLASEPGGGAAGSTYYSLRFTNLSSRSCTLRGYPGISAVDLRGRQLGSAGRRAPSTIRTVALAPAGEARAVLQIVQAANYPNATCRRVTAAGLRVYPPGATVAKLVPFPFSACSRAGPVILSVKAVA